MENSTAWYTGRVQPYSLYLHIPFCQLRCSYCDFNTYEGLEVAIPAYVDALCRELESSTMDWEKDIPVHTVYLGGGTPSLLPVELLIRIINTVMNCFDLLSELELTLEANPGTISREYLKDIRQAGVNRLSLGMQSANPGELKLLERRHGFGDVVNAVTWARQAGIHNINLDLIFGLPYQTIESWQRSLDLAINLKPTHFSLYALTLEGEAPMHHWVEKGKIKQPDPDLAAEMYERASERLNKAGYIQYEISNWALRSDLDEHFYCKHNLQYWRNLPYLGMGAGAHGYANGSRTINVFTPIEYIQKCMNIQTYPFPKTLATEKLVPVDIDTEMAETMIMGLRLVSEGVSEIGFYQRFNRELKDVFKDEITTLISQGLLEWDNGTGGNLRLTSKGRLLGNQVFIKFV